MPKPRIGLRFLAAACLAVVPPLDAAEPPLPAAGKLLVATRKMPDADFARAVVLLLHSDSQGVVGLFVNRPTEVPLSHLFPELKDAPTGQAPVYLGGLVALGARGLVRSLEHNPGKAAPEKTSPPKSSPHNRDAALPVFGGVSLITDSTALEKLALTGARPDVFRVYAGYTGWSDDQLRNELKLGYWTVATPTESIVFDLHPETLWPRLSGQTR